MPAPYLASSLPAHEVAELQRLMAEEVREVAIFFLNPDGIVTVWNRGAEDMKGYPAGDVIGNHLEMLYTEEDRARGWAQHNLDAAAREGFYREETYRRKKDGSLFWARITLTALRDDTGQLIGFSKITVDLTEHRLLELCIREREKIRRILHAANAGTWTWHHETDQMDVSGDVLGLKDDDAESVRITFVEWLADVHPEDRQHVAGQFAQALAAGRCEPVTMEARIRSHGCEFRWFHIRADWYRKSDVEPYVLSGVNVDIQELRTTSEELRQAVGKLRQADARKDDFLAMLAHELRNPLAPIRAAAELLSMVELDESRVRKTSEIIGRQVDHMTSLIDDLLDVSRVTRGLITLEQMPHDMRDIINDAVEQVNPLLVARRVHLAVQASARAATVSGDKKRLVQVLANLLTNAAKYTPEDGNVILRTVVAHGTVEVSVADDGIGMTPELTAHVFDLFAQAERTPDRSSGGLGLGLSLVRSLIELHGGSVTCRSDGPDKGSIFTVRLPLAMQRVDEEAVESVFDVTPSPDKSLRVLVVDDNADAAQMLAMLVEASGCQVVVEHGARPALERARLVPPDVCLLDIGLPEINGNEMARRLKSDPTTAEAVLIAITGYGQDQDREDALQAGFDYYFVKPVDTSRLVAILAGIRH